MTRRLFKQRNELLRFFREKNHDFLVDLESREFIARLAYLFDIFDVLNNLNMSFQGPNGTLSEYISKLEGFIRKQAHWIENVKNKNYAMLNSSPRLRTNLRMNFLKKLSATFCN